MGVKTEDTLFSFGGLDGLDVGKVQETYRKEEEVVLSSQEHQQLLPQLLMLKITAKNQCCSFKERENQF